MRSRKKLLTSFVAAAGGILLEIIAFACGLMGGPPAGPQSLREVAQIAADMGLHHDSPRRSVVDDYSLVVSDRPLTWERVNELRFNSPEHPGWRGTVAVCYPADRFMANYDPEFSIVWGKMFVYGDPHIMRRLTNQLEGGQP